MTPRRQSVERYSRTPRRGFEGPPYGYEDLPEQLDGCWRDEDTLNATFIPPTGTLRYRSLPIWRDDHPRDRTAIAVLRDPTLPPCEVGWRVASQAHDPWSEGNAWRRAA